MQRDYMRLWTKDSTYGPMSKGIVFAKLELELDANFTLAHVIKAVSNNR